MATKEYQAKQDAQKAKIAKTIARLNQELADGHEMGVDFQLQAFRMKPDQAYTVFAGVIKIMGR